MPDKSLPTNDVIETADDFEVAYKKHAPLVYRFLFWRTQNEALSEDLTSNVFEKAWRARSSFHGGSTCAWLMRIARNVLTDHWRKKGDLPVEDIELVAGEDSKDMSEALDKELEATKLRAALAKLPPEMRQVVEFRFLQGLSGREVAARLSLSESNVRVIQYRALKKLRGYLS
jgi:RNA polymerase sigma-70 factor (ECF subfamily)